MCWTIHHVKKVSIGKLTPKILDEVQTSFNLFFHEYSNAVINPNENGTETNKKNP